MNDVFCKWRPTRILGIALLVTGALSAPATYAASKWEIERQAKIAFEQMKASIPRSRNPQARAYVTCVARSIVQELDEPYRSEDWEIELFEHEAANAFAMPGGKIGIFTGIFQVADNQDALAAVIGHEVAHVTEKHSLKRANRQTWTNVGVNVLAGVVGGNTIPRGAAADLLGMGAQVGLNLPYGRKQESQADIVGLDYMAKAGYYPLASINLWKNMEKQKKGAPAEFLSTHPSSDKRMGSLIKQMPRALTLRQEANEQGKLPRCGVSSVPKPKPAPVSSEETAEPAAAAEG